MSKDLNEQIIGTGIASLPADLAEHSNWTLYKISNKIHSPLIFGRIEHHQAIELKDLHDLKQDLDEDRIKDQWDGSNYEGIAYIDDQDAYNAKIWLLGLDEDLIVESFDQINLSDEMITQRRSKADQAKADAKAKAKAEAEAKQQALEDRIAKLNAMDTNSKAKIKPPAEADYKQTGLEDQASIMHRVTEQISGGVDRFFGIDGDGGKFNVDAMYRCLTRDCGFDFICLPQEDVVRYRNNGVYIGNRSRVIEKAIDRLLGSKTDPTYFKKVVALIKDRDAIGEDASSAFPALHEKWLNFSNGMLHIESGELWTHDDFYSVKQHQDLKSVIQFQVGYNDQAKNREFEQYLHGVLASKAEVDFLIKAIGYSFLQYSDMQRFFILQGPSNTGKSTILKVIRALHGSYNVSSTPLHDIDNASSRFGLSKLYGKTANICEEIGSQPLSGSGQLKQAVEGSPQNIEEKYVASYSAKLFATIFGATNQPLRSLDRSSGFANRLNIIPCEKIHGSVDQTWEERLLRSDVLEGAMHLAIKALQELMQDGQLIETPAMLDAKKLNLASECQVQVFGIKFLQRGVKVKHQGRMEHARLKLADLHRLYEEWIKAELDAERVRGVKIEKRQSFNAKLQDWANIAAARGQIWGIEGDSVLTLDGIALNAAGDKLVQEHKILVAGMDQIKVVDQSDDQ